MTYTTNNDYDYDLRTYGIGNLSPLLGMGSTLANMMGHGNISKMLTQANGLMGQFNSIFPKNIGTQTGFPGLGGGGLFGVPNFNGQQPGFGGSGFPFMPPQSTGFGSGAPFYPQGYGYQPSLGTQGGGFGHFMSSFLGFPGMAPGFGGGMPGYFY